MRKTVITVRKGLYLLLTEMIAVYLIAFPVHAFQVSSSSTGYVRVATASAISAYQVAQRAAFTGAARLGHLGADGGLGGGAARYGAGRVGAARGVGGADLGEHVLLAQEVQAVKTAALAAQPSTIDDSRLYDASRIDVLQ